MQLHGLLGLNR